MRRYAEMIPSKVRDTLLLTDEDPINTAHATTGCDKMAMLSDVWYTFIEPKGTKSNCPICMNRILQSFKQLYPILCDMKNREDLLNNFNEKIRSNKDIRG